MANTFNTESRLLLGKREAVAGVAETLTSADGDVRVRTVELSNLTVEYDDESSKYLTGDHTRDEAIAGIARGSIDFGIKMAVGEFVYATSGVATPKTPKLPYKKYMESAGFTVSAVNPTDYSTEDGYWLFSPEKEADEQTSTIALYDIETGATGKGIEYKLAGCVGTFTLGVESTGKPFMGQFSMQGKVSDVREVDHASLPSFDDGKALSTLADPMLNTIVRLTEVNRDGSAIVGATPYNLCLNAFSIDGGLTVAEIQCQSDAYGIKNNVITMRDPRISMSPMLATISEFNFWSAMNDMKVYKVEILAYKDAAKTKPAIQIIAPRCQLLSTNGADDNGFRRQEYVLRPMRNLQGATALEKQHDYTIKIYGVNTLK